MANYRNHVVDPTYFYDAIAEFAFCYDMYVHIGQIVDDAGYQRHTYKKQEIVGSLQIQTDRRSINKLGSTDEVDYMFYCKSLYRIQKGDFIHYKNLWLICDAIHEYDEYGVREAHLTAVQLTTYTDLLAYVKFLEGSELV